MITLHHEHLIVQVSPQGAELQSIKHIGTGIEYLWQGDAAYWSKRSPVLFPIVGTLRNDTYEHEGKAYQLGRHGFARDMPFEAVQHNETSASFILRSSEATRERYPFDFVFQVHYKLQNGTLHVGYEVENTGQEPMLFSAGGHPAFNVPLVPGTQYHDHVLEFDQPETAGRWLLQQGLIDAGTTPLLEQTQSLPLSPALFYQDAVVLKQLQSKRVTLKSNQHPHGLHFGFEGFPFLGIWASKDAPFVCIEPWCGIADSVLHNGQLNEKEGIETLAPQGNWQRTWTVTCF